MSMPIRSWIPAYWLLVGSASSTPTNTQSLVPRSIRGEAASVHAVLLEPRLSGGAKSGISVAVTLSFITLIASLAIYFLVRTREQTLLKPSRAPAAIAASEGIQFDESFVKAKDEGLSRSLEKKKNVQFQGAPYEPHGGRKEEWSGCGGGDAAMNETAFITPPAQTYAPHQQQHMNQPVQYTAVYPGQQEVYSHPGIVAPSQSHGNVYAGPSYTQYQQPPQAYAPAPPICHQGTQATQHFGTYPAQETTTLPSSNYIHSQGQPQAHDYNYQSPQQTNKIISTGGFDATQNAHHYQQYPINAEDNPYTNNTNEYNNLTVNHGSHNISSESSSNNNSNSNINAHHPTPTLEPISTAYQYPGPSSSAAAAMRPLNDNSAANTTASPHPGVSATMTGYEALDLDRYSAAFEDFAPYRQPDDLGSGGCNNGGGPSGHSRRHPHPHISEMIGEGHYQEAP